MIKCFVNIIYFNPLKFSTILYKVTHPFVRFYRFLSMLRHQVLSQAFRISRKTPDLKHFFFQNVRCVTAVSSAKETFDDEALANAKPFEKIPSMPILPFVGTGWIYLPIVGKYSKYVKNKTIISFAFSLLFS